jgi:hypothetical protein
VLGATAGVALVTIFRARSELARRRGAEEGFRQPTWGGFEIEDVLYLIAPITWIGALPAFVAAALLFLGLLTPFAGAAVIGVMLVAWITNHRGNGFFIFRPGEGWEYVMTLTFCGLLLSVIGAGEWSLDNAVGLFDDPVPGAAGLWIALLFGAGGALALLGAFWRPEKKSAG